MFRSLTITAARPQLFALRRLSSQQIPQPTAAQPLYSVRRSLGGALPVYGDIRNAGTRYLLYIRNVTGAERLAEDLESSLFAPGSPEATRLKVRVLRNRHVVIQGGRAEWRNPIVEWLTNKGL